MSDISFTTSAAIHIGGIITENGLDTLVCAIAASSVGGDWGAKFHSAAEIVQHARAAAASGSPLDLVSFEAPDGAFPTIEQACRDLGLTYVRGTDCRPDGSGAVVMWWPGMDQPRSWVGTVDAHEPCLPYRRIVELIEADELPKELALMKAAFERPEGLQIAA